MNKFLASLKLPIVLLTLLSLGVTLFNIGNGVFYLGLTYLLMCLFLILLDYIQYILHDDYE